MLKGVVCICCLLLISMTTLAQEPDNPEHSALTWQASYWNNITLAGAPVLLRQETMLTHDWGAGSPDSSVNADAFSARWTRYINVSPNTYRFTVTSDDGVRVWVDGDLLIDEWSEHSAQTFVADKYLDASHHLVVVEFYEKSGLALIHLAWQALPADDDVWQGEYYDNADLSGAPVLVRYDANIDFDWGDGSPAPGVIGSDQFSVRWTRQLDLPAGTCRFAMTVDDGGRLWVNGHLLLEVWRDQAERTFTETIYLPGGPLPVTMEYYESVDRAVARLNWTPVDEPPPQETIIVDDGDPGFVTGGLPTSWRTANEGYGGQLTWTRNNDWPRPSYNWARWYPDLSAGRYEVFVFIPERYTTSAQVRYWVSHADGYTLRIVDQSANGDRWVSLGAFGFAGGDDEYVSLSDVTYETRLTQLIAFDAVKWLPR